MIKSLSKGVIDNTYFPRVHYYLLVNTPASMYDKYEALNAVGKNVFRELKKYTELEYYDIQVLITIIEFDQTCRITHCAEDILDFTWSTIHAGQGVFLGYALEKLSNLLYEDRRNCFSNGIPISPPIIICLGHSTPMDNFIDILNLLKVDKWFNMATKISIRVGDYDWVDEYLVEFACDKRAVFVANTSQDLYSIFRSVIIGTFFATIKGKLDNVSLNQHRLQYIYNHLSMVPDNLNAPYTYSENSWDVTLNNNM